MVALYIYVAFSYLFMWGLFGFSKRPQHQKVSLIALSPITMPTMLGAIIIDVIPDVINHK